MDKILNLLLNEYKKEKPSAEYQLILKKACEAEAAFMATLDKKQKAKYLELDFIEGEVVVAELQDLAEFLFKHLKI